MFISILYIGLLIIRRLLSEIAVLQHVKTCVSCTDVLPSGERLWKWNSARLHAWQLL